MAISENLAASWLAAKPMRYKCFVLHVSREQINLFRNPTRGNQRKVVKDKREKIKLRRDRERDMQEKC